MRLTSQTQAVSCSDEFSDQDPEQKPSPKKPFQHQSDKHQNHSLYCHRDLSFVSFGVRHFGMEVHKLYTKRIHIVFRAGTHATILHRLHAHKHLPQHITHTHFVHNISQTHTKTCLDRVDQQRFEHLPSFDDEDGQRRNVISTSSDNDGEIFRPQKSRTTSKLLSTHRWIWNFGSTPPIPKRPHKNRTHSPSQNFSQSLEHPTKQNRTCIRNIPNPKYQRSFYQHLSNMESKMFICLRINV